MENSFDNKKQLLSTNVLSNDPNSQTNDLIGQTSEPVQMNSDGTSALPSFEDKFDAGMNMWGSVITPAASELYGDTRFHDRAVQGFNAYDEQNYSQLTDGMLPSEIERYGDNFHRATSLEHGMWIRKNIDKQLKLERVAQQDSSLITGLGYAGGALVGMVTAPENILFGAGFFTKAARAVEMVTKNKIISNAAAGVITNTAMQTTNYQLGKGTAASLSDEQYKTGLVWGTVLGGGLGALIGGASRMAADEIISSYSGFADEFVLQQNLAKVQTENAKRFISQGVYGEAVVKNADGSVTLKEVLQPDGTIGAARDPRANIELALAGPDQGTLSPSGLAFHAYKALLDIVSPKYRAMGNSLISLREYFQKMAPFTAKLTKPYENITAEVMRDILTAELKHGLSKGNAESLKMATEFDPQIKPKDFFRQVDESLKTNTPSSNPGVKNLVENYIQPLLKKIDEEATSRGFYEKRELGGRYYFPQLIDSEKLLNQPAKAILDIAKGMKNFAIKEEARIRLDAEKANKHLQSILESAQSEIDMLKKSGAAAADIKDKVKALTKLTKHIKKKGYNLSKVLTTLGRSEELSAIELSRKVAAQHYGLKQSLSDNNFEKLADEYIQNKIHKNLNHVTSTVFKPSQYKHLELRVETADIKDFLSDTDYLTQLTAYVTDHAKAIAKFDTYGDLTGEIPLQNMIAEYNKRIAGLSPDSKEFKTLTDDLNEGKKMMELQNRRFDGLNPDGTKGYSGANMVVDVVGMLTNFKLMAKSALAQIGDWGGPLVDFATGRFTKFHKQAMELVGDDIKMLATAEDKLLICATVEGFDFRALDRLAESLSPDQSLGKFSITDMSTWKGAIGRAVRVGNDANYRLNGMTYVNNVARTIISEKVSKKMVEAAIVFTKDTAAVSDEELAHFAQYGISQNDLFQIAEQFNTHSKVMNGYRYANVSEWDDRIRRKVLGAVKGEVDKEHIIQPDGTTKGYWTDKQMLKLFAKYQGFLQAALESYGLAATQKGGYTEAAKFLTRNMLGSLSYVLKASLRKPMEEIDTSPERLMYEGLAASGADMGATWIGNQLDFIGSATNRNIGPRRWLGFQNNRYQSQQGLQDYFLGAGATVFSDADKIMKAKEGRFLETGVKVAGPYNPITNNIPMTILKNMAFGYPD